MKRSHIPILILVVLLIVLAVVLISRHCHRGGSEIPNVDLQQTDIIEKHVFKGSMTDEPLYGYLKYDIHWPAAMEGYDLVPLQQALLTIMGSQDPNVTVKDFIKSYDNEIFPTDRWTQTSDTIPEEAYADPEKVIAAGYDMPYPPDGSIAASLVYLDGERGLLCYKVETFLHAGCGLGACCNNSLDYIYYDLAKAKVVTFDDLFKQDANDHILKLLKDAPTFANDVTPDLVQVKRLPSRWYLDDGSIYFIYDKYEIGCGADGEISLGLPLDTLSTYLTPYAKQLFF